MQNEGSPEQTVRPGVLAGLKVLDLAHHYSAAFAACLLADYGAEVTAVESPDGNVLRSMQPRRGDVSLWSAVAERNKSNISLRLSDPEGRRMFLELAKGYDVVIENFRPGTLEKWGIGPDDLAEAGANVVLLRVSGYGQTGPRSARPGFGGAAEAMSGLSQMTGPADGNPILLSTAIADSAAGAFGIIGVLAALWRRASDRAEGRAAAGVEVIDIALFEAIYRLIPTQVIEYDQTGNIPGRAGSVREHGNVRNIYRAADGVHFCVSSVGERAIRRTLTAAGATDCLDELAAGALHRSNDEVVRFIDSCDRAFADWAAGMRFADLAGALDCAGVVFEQVYTVADIVEDKHYLARGDVIQVQDDQLGPVRMPGVIPKFSGYDHLIRHAGRAIGADNAAIYGARLGLDEQQLSSLHDKGVI